MSANDQPQVIVVIPTYNEATVIVTTLTKVREALPGALILVMDDASPDGTGPIVAEYARRDSRMEVVNRSGKSGLGRAYEDGFRRAIKANPRVIVQMDADLSHDPRALPALVDPILSGSADLVLGSRRVPSGGTIGWDRRRAALSWFGGAYANALLGLHASDPTGGYRAWSANLLARVIAQQAEAAGYGFQIELLWRARRLGARVLEVPIIFRERERGVSKMSAGIALEAALLVLRLALFRWKRIGRSRERTQ